MFFQGGILLLCCLIGVIKGDCSGESGQFEYSINNQLEEPYFFYTVSLPIDCSTDATTLFKYDYDYLASACDTNADNFKNFEMKYYPKWGYYVTAINDVHETNETFWELIDYTTGKQYDVGLCSFVPQVGDHVAWNLTVIDFEMLANWNYTTSGPTTTTLEPPCTKRRR